jgi:hypothetical protein
MPDGAPALAGAPAGPAREPASSFQAPVGGKPLAGLAKKSITVDVLERVRQVGPNKAGAQGSFTVYRVAE